MLTVSRRVRGGIPDGGEGSIRLEEVSHNLCTLHLQLVTTQAANGSQVDASGGADGRKMGMSSILERLERRICPESLA